MMDQTKLLLSGKGYNSWSVPWVRLVSMQSCYFVTKNFKLINTSSARYCHRHHRLSVKAFVLKTVHCVYSIRLSQLHTEFKEFEGNSKSLNKTNSNNSLARQIVPPVCKLIMNRLWINFTSNLRSKWTANTQHTSWFCQRFS